MSRLKKADQAGVTYQGSATSVGFNPQQARSTAKADKQRADQIVADGTTLQRELQREQQAATSALTFQQRADSGMEKLKASTESGIFKANQSIEADNLRLQQKYDTDSLKLEHTFEKGQLDLKAGLLKAQGSVDAARTKLVGTAINSMLSFAGSAVTFADQVDKQGKKNQQQDQAIKDTFAIANGETQVQDSAARVQDANVAAGAVATEDAIQSSVSDPVLQDAVRGGVSASTVQNQVRRGTAYNAATDWPTFHNSWVNDLGVTYTRADGSTFTAATIRDAADVTMIDSAAKNAFYGAAGIGDMPRDQVATTLVPVVESVSRGWIQQTNNAIIKGAQAERVKSAQVSIEEGLRSGDDVGTVFRNGFSDVYSSGGYVGNKGGATEDTVKTILNYAVRTNRPEIIKALAKEYKIVKDGVPQEGTQLERQYGDLFETAREGVVTEFLSDQQRELAVAKNAIVMGERDRMTLLSEAETPEQEAQINLEAAAAYDALGTAEGDLKAAELRAAKNYSPFTFSDMKEQQDKGLAKWSNSYLHSLVSNGELKGAEAKTLGYDSRGALSADDAASARAADFKSETTSQGKRAVTQAIGKDGNGGDALKSDDLRVIMEGQGASIINDINDRLQDELSTLLRVSPDTSDADIREFMVRRGLEMAEEVSYKNKQLDYTFGGVNKPSSIPISEVTPTSFGSGNALILDYRGYSAEQLRTQPNTAITVDAVLNEREIYRAGAALKSGQPIPQEIEAKASALGTNAQTLLKAQMKLYEIPYPAMDQKSSYESYETSSYQSSGDLAQYDTGASYNGISLDNLRNSVINNESGGNYSAVNPHSGALGYGQVMPANVPSWSKQALGYQISTREFLRDPKLQMQVINHRFEVMLKDQAAAGYSGSEAIRRVAAIWYSGQGKRWNDPTPEYYDGHPYPSVADYTLDILERYRG